MQGQFEKARAVVGVEGAEIFVDGKLVGRAPLGREVEAGWWAAGGRSGEGSFFLL